MPSSNNERRVKTGREKYLTKKLVARWKAVVPLIGGDPEKLAAAFAEFESCCAELAEEQRAPAEDERGSEADREAHVLAAQRS